jgi:diguanylate cyclase (GGDEF)-like protein
MLLPLLVVAVVLALVANVVLVAMAVVPWLRARRTARAEAPRQAGRADPAAAGNVATAPYDRLLRVVGFTYLFSLLAIVAIGHPWPAEETTILVLLAVGGGVVIVVNDLLVGHLAGGIRYGLEALGATIVTSAFVAVTGGAFSPFVVGYVVIIVATAPIVRPIATLALVALSVGGLLAASAVGTAGGLAAQGAPVLVAVDVVALVLVAAISAVVAREQGRAHDAAVRLSQVDQLTELFNRTRFFLSADREIERSRRSGRTFCLLMADLDDLKQVNDTFGHDAGDRYIRGVADAIRRSIRRLDVPARYAGDEFIVLLPETTIDGAIVVAEKIRLGVAALTLETDGRLARSSVSIGVVAYPSDGNTADELVKSADRAMYSSKRMGKDRVVRFYDEGTPRRRRRVPVVVDGPSRADGPERPDEATVSAYAAAAPDAAPDAGPRADPSRADTRPVDESSPGGVEVDAVAIPIDSERARAGGSVGAGPAWDASVDRRPRLEA